MSKKLKWIIIILLILIVALVGLKMAGVFGKDEGTKVTAEKAVVEVWGLKTNMAVK